MPSSRFRGWRRISRTATSSIGLPFTNPGDETSHGRGDTVRILYLADIRFPLERANGIQSMETCHALAARGHDVAFVVRPDTHEPARDPFAFYGLPRIPSLTIEVAPVTGPQVARRTGYLTFAMGRALGRARQDAVFT